MLVFLANLFIFDVNLVWATAFESIMLICFGISWPISVYKSLTSKSTKGKSVIFLFAIILGYIAGILGKIISNNISYVLVFYIINISVVSFDTVLYFINKKKKMNNQTK